MTSGPSLIETARLTLEPLGAGHAVEMLPVLADPELYGFTGGRPPTPAELRRRYAAQAVGRSADGSECWLNWIVRDRRTGAALGFVQATVRDRDGRPLASVAWLIGVGGQRRGVATEAARAMLGWLGSRGISAVDAYIHPDHEASMAVARRCGLTPTDVEVDGEVRWARTDLPASVTTVPSVTAPLTARADVVTDAPERYAKQLVSHLGRRVEFASDGDRSTARFGEGTGTVVVGDGVLTLLAEGPDDETLARVQDVLGRHLERFGQRNELTVTWVSG